MKPIFCAVRPARLLAVLLGCDLVAEGVETREQREILHRLGCQYAQGWLVGDASDSLIFGGADEAKWAAALQGQGIDPSMLSGVAGRA